MKGWRKGLAVLGAVVIVGMVAFKLTGGGVAPVPEVFANGLTIEQAIERGTQSGKPVLVLVTADWCGSCQRFKKGPVSRPEVAGFISEHFEPVYINADENRQLASKLEIEGVPAMRVLHPGRPFDRLDSYAESDQLLKWLEKAAQS